MFARRRPVTETLSISALDLFATSLGVFVLMSILLFPYYLRQPAMDDAIAGAEASLSDARAAMDEALELAERAEEERRAAADARRRRARELEDAKAALAAAEAETVVAEEAAAGAEARREGLEREAANIPITDLDLVFVLDTTGSMRDEIEDMQANLLGIVRILSRLAPSLNVGFVAYRDVTDAYLMRDFPTEPVTGASLARLRAFVNALGAAGGGDPPEPVDRALERAAAMPWRDDAEGRIVVIGDAPPVPTDWARAFRVAAGYAASAPDPTRVRRVSAIFTGRSSVGRDFFQRLAASGGGDFVSHRGRMIESVMLSVLRTRAERAATEGAR